MRLFKYIGISQLWNSNALWSSADKETNWNEQEKQIQIRDLTETLYKNIYIYNN